MTFLDDIIRRSYASLRGTGLDADLRTADIVRIAVRRVPELARGAASRRWWQGERGTLWRGPRVSLVGRSRIMLGPGVVLGEGVHINGMSHLGVSLGRNATVGRQASILGSGTMATLGMGVTVGERSAIGAGNVVWGQGGVTIGDNVLMGPYVVVVSANHGFRDLAVPIREQAETYGPVIIEDDCWIGTGATLLAGSHVGRGSVVAAGSVVRGAFPPNSILGGVPARILGDRAEGEAPD